MPKNTTKKMKKIIYSLLLASLTAFSTQGQSISYEEFQRAVAGKNAGYLAEKYNVDIATANLEAAKVFNDPELSVGYGNNQDWSVQMGQAVEAELSYDLDLSGVRKARIATAGSEKDLTEASVAAYLNSLRMEAAEAWAEAWRLRESCAVLEQAVADMVQIARGDSLRLTLGDVGRADAMQSRLEARTLSGELVALKAEYQNALTTLSVLCGGEKISSIQGDLPSKSMIFSLEQICEMAESNRSDLKAAELSHTLSENNLRLVKATRGFEMGVNVGYSYNTEVRNEIAPAPIYNGLSVGVTIPLKFSSANKGELNAAKAQIVQSQKYFDAARIQVRAEATQAYNSLLAAAEVMNNYDGSLLSDAKDIAESRKQGYIQGESSLLELLSAQQTYRDVMQAYIDACCNRYLCQAALEKAVGTAW